MNARQLATAAGVTLTLLAASAVADGRATDAQVDQAVLSNLASTYKIHADVVSHIDLTGAFGTESQWTFVVAKQPDDESNVLSGGGNKEGAVSACFVKELEPDCSDTLFLPLYRTRGFLLAAGERPFYDLFKSQIVYSSLHAPLLILKACSVHGGNGSCGISTFLFVYDKATDRFRIAFSNMTGRNNNEETRFIESGPLQGDVVVANPPGHAPFRYSIEVYRPAAGGNYGRILSYRGQTSYDDGNPLPVIDSEMPVLLKRLGHWKAGDALPVPTAMPAGCTRLFLRKGVEWCGPDTGDVAR